VKGKEKRCTNSNRSVLILNFSTIVEEVNGTPWRLTSPVALLGAIDIHHFAELRGRLDGELELEN
jgi:hypothetical protein